MARSPAGLGSIPAALRAPLTCTCLHTAPPTARCHCWKTHLPEPPWLPAPAGLLSRPGCSSGCRRGWCGPAGAHTTPTLVVGGLMGTGVCPINHLPTHLLRVLVQAVQHLLQSAGGWALARAAAAAAANRTGKDKGGWQPVHSPRSSLSRFRKTHRETHTHTSVCRLLGMKADTSTATNARVGCCCAAVDPILSRYASEGGCSGEKMTVYR